MKSAYINLHVTANCIVLYCKKEKGKGMAERGVLWFRIQLSSSNVGANDGLMIAMADVEKLCTDYEKEALNGNAIRSAGGIPLRMIDIDEGTENAFTFKFCPTLRSYVLADGWHEFVQRKGLNEGDNLTFWRVQFDGQFRFFITGRQWCPVQIDGHFAG